MEKSKIIVAIVSVIVTISVIGYIVTLPKPTLEEPNWIAIVALLFLYWMLFINWYSKRKRE
ncbi:hypothetical protein DRO69_09440 [Candidatus Bathyarchaeota archaeon]|nr:MAG: hypothetical protein DRO69_09440 [Candidatus Bathyarchaeota archaeon]